MIQTEAEHASAGKNVSKKVKNRRRAARVTALVILCVCAVFAAGCLFINLYLLRRADGRIFTAEALPDVEKDGRYDCILIFGAGVRADGTPSPMLEERLSCGLSLYQRGAAGKILVSGDHGAKSYDEVNTMKDWLCAAGVPSEDVFMDHAGFSTYDSICRAVRIFGAEDALLVTQRYHLPRALYLADRLELRAVGVDAEKTVYRGHALRTARETAARVKDFFAGIFRPAPKYLGDTLPISGSGNVTNDR